MTYTFDPDSGGTFEQLQELVLAQSFNATRYREFVKAWLNDGVTEACKRLEIHRGAEILDFDAAGLVAQPESPYFRVDELWLADSNASGTTLDAVRRHSRARLESMTWRTPAHLGPGTQPLVFTAQRKTSPTSRYPQLQIHVLPATGAAGKAAIVGLQRPPVMSDVADLTGLGADLDDAVVSWAKSRAFRQESDREMSDFWLGQFTLALSSASMPAVSDGPVITPGTWGDGFAPRHG